MEEIDRKLESLLKFLAEWQAAQRISLGKFLTAAELADLREPERMVALGRDEAPPALPSTALTVGSHEQTGETAHPSNKNEQKQKGPRSRLSPPAP
jgi:hypothetical protein